eukprot:gnl/MRDRNA2_/MRDRNA2_60368_c0_seq1.p1 gnl/MRDRNA2_/MRDRNA2_60368_c0~~gnl/MRDRNA2_/MRDRNA2_60368_c0_seq1.p1  ORF type:complete len:338 (+),score=94.58 gnl/MRDRNA2_/MRDRNA2_60368_c0_seq1:101-1015(+)
MHSIVIQCVFVIKAHAGAFVARRLFDDLTERHLGERWNQAGGGQEDGQKGAKRQREESIETPFFEEADELDEELRAEAARAEEAEAARAEAARVGGAAQAAAAATPGEAVTAEAAKAEAARAAVARAGGETTKEVAAVVEKEAAEKEKNSHIQNDANETVAIFWQNLNGTQLKIPMVSLRSGKRFRQDDRFRQKLFKLSSTIDHEVCVKFPIILKDDVNASAVWCLKTSLIDMSSSSMKVSEIVKCGAFQDWPGGVEAQDEAKRTAFQEAAKELQTKLSIAGGNSADDSTPAAPSVAKPNEVAE